MPDTVPIDVDKLAALHDRNRDLTRELGETNILLDGARAALRTANAELVELRAELDATRERARLLVEAARPGADRGDAVCANIIETALHVVGATRRKPDLSAAEQAAAELAELRAMRARALDMWRRDSLADEEVATLALVLGRFTPTSDEPPGCVGSPDDPQTARTGEEGDMSG